MTCPEDYFCDVPFEKRWLVDHLPIAIRIGYTKIDGLISHVPQCPQTIVWKEGKLKNNNDSPLSEYDERVLMQDARLKKEGKLAGWEQCRYLDENDRRCPEPSVIGGYCRAHLLEYPYPHLVERPRDRWSDAAVIASSPGYVLMMLMWLVVKGHVEHARDLALEISGQLEEIVRKEGVVTQEAEEIFRRWYQSTPRQMIEYRIYLVLQGYHDPGYESILQQFKASGMEQLDPGE